LLSEAHNLEVDKEVENWYKQILELYANKYEKQDQKL